MILVSFSSAEDVWSNDVNKYNTFSLQGTENPPFFFWDTRYKGGEQTAHPSPPPSVFNPNLPGLFCELKFLGGGAIMAPP